MSCATIYTVLAPLRFGSETGGVCQCVGGIPTASGSGCTCGCVWRSSSGRIKMKHQGEEKQSEPFCAHFRIREQKVESCSMAPIGFAFCCRLP